MKTEKQNTLLFPDEEFEGSKRQLVLNKERMLEIIERILQEKTLTSMKQKVFELKDVFANFKKDNLGLLNIGTNGDTIKITQEYLFNELKQIVEAKTQERSKYYLKRLSKVVSKSRTSKINDINLNRWKEYEDIITDSLWVLKKRDNSGVHHAGYWGNFIPQIPQQMIKRFTKKGEWVLDAFAGCGTTLIEAQRLGRNCIGIELQDKIAQTANKLINSEKKRFDTINEVVTGDSSTIDYNELLSNYRQECVHLVIMHPPYFDIIKFSDHPHDLSNTRTVTDFLELMGNIVNKASSVLAKGRYLAIVIGDKYSKGEWIPLGFMTMNEVMKQGFTLKSVIVKNFEETLGKRNQKELWRYRALVGGFYIFKHEYIFLFKKR